MFYLLEDNRIIDSNTSFTKNIPLWEVKDNLLFAKSKNGKLIKPYKYNAIKNQSENVFDLINKKEDLVKIDGQIIMVKTINGDLRNLSGISAIYKPDDKGNYIKVWEKKYEKNNKI